MMKYTIKLLLNEFEIQSLVIFLDETPLHKGIEKTKEWMPKNVSNIYMDISRATSVTLLMEISEKGILAYEYFTVPLNALIYWNFIKKLIENNKKNSELQKFIREKKLVIFHDNGSIHYDFETMAKLI